MSRKTKVLLVDDSKFLRLATERALARAGYESLLGHGWRTCPRDRTRKKARRHPPGYAPAENDGPDVLKALKKDPATAGIAVVVFTGLSQKNAVRLQEDGACAFLEKSQLGLDKGCETLLTALAGMVRNLHLDAPTPFTAK